MRLFLPADAAEAYARAYAPQKHLFVGSRAADFLALWIQILAKLTVKGILGGFENDEGFAEYFSTIEVDGKQAKLGKKPPPGDWELLHQYGMMKVSDMFRVQHNSREYARRRSAVGVLCEVMAPGALPRRHESGREVVSGRN